VAASPELREPYAPDLPEDPSELALPDDERIELAVGVLRGDLTSRSLRALDLTDVRVEGADWANVRVPRASWTRVELRSVRLTGAELAEGTFRDVTFVDCRVDLTGMRSARLERVRFEGCRLEELDLYGARLADVRFERCELREATFSGTTLGRCAIAGCDLSGLRGAESLAGIRMTWDDVLANAPVFALALGIDIVD
jgi:uncharacterized protein YjbI with pentapeptide repeats